MAAAGLEAILAGLLTPNNDVIQQNTAKLKEAFKDPATLPALCHLLGNSENAQVRQLAAVLIRRKVHKNKQWNAVTQEVRQGIRDNILQLLLQEPERGVRNSIASLVGTAAKHDLPTNSWPQLFEFLLTYTKSTEPAQRELGMLVLHTVAQMASEQLKPHVPSILQLLTEKLSDTQHYMVPYYAIRTMSELVFFAGDAEGKLIQGALPQVLAVVQQLTEVDEEKACEALELFDELLETEVAIIVPHLKPFLQFCLQVASKSEFSDELRVKAMSFTAALTRLKKKAVLKNHLVEPFLQVLLPIMCSDPEETDDEEAETEAEAESHTPSQYALQVLDTLALHLPPEKFIPKLMPMVEKCLSSDKAKERRAGYLAMAVVVEGCADYVMNKLMNAMLQSVCQGLNDPDVIVRDAALFALGQFSEHLQPNITKFAAELLPLLFKYLNKATQEADKHPKGLTKSYYALEMFIENLGLEILPYLPELMNHLLTVLKNSSSVRSKELAISAIGAAATAACEGMKPYFQEIIEHFRGYLIAGTDKDTKKLQVATIDTLGVLARNVGEETFMPLAKECVELGLGLLENADDPDLRRCVYGLFAAISGLVKQDLKPYIENIINYLLLSLRSTEGVTAHYKEDTEPVAIFNEEALEDEDEDLQDSDEEEENLDVMKLEGISVENAYLDEKEDACCALGELAQHTSFAFLPFLETVYTEVLELVGYPAAGIKKAAMATLCRLCLCVSETCSQAQSGDAGNALKTMLCTVVPKYLEIAKTDQDRTVVMSAVDSLHELLDNLGSSVLQVTDSTDQILQTMKDIFTHKVACQDQEEDDEEHQAEYDGMLIESAGDVLPVMARIMGGPAFCPFFNSFLTDLLKRLKQSSATTEKSFAVGTIAEVIESIGESSVQFVDTLYPVFLRMVKDEDEEVRSNAIFALGVLAANGGDKMKERHQDILKMLLEMMEKEEEGRLMDNTCAAVCRIVWTNADNLPLQFIVPAVIQRLPLTEDYEENATVFTCLLHLYQNSNPEVISSLPKLLHVAATILGTEQAKPDTQKLLVQFVQSVNERYTDSYSSTKAAMPEEMAHKLDHCLTIDLSAASVANGC